MELMTDICHRKVSDRPGEYEGPNGPIVVANTFREAKDEAIDILENEIWGLNDLIDTIRATKKNKGARNRGLDR